MAALVNALRLYVHYARVSVRGQMQYRASVVTSAIGIFLQGASETLAIWALFDRFGQIRGWTLAEVALFYGIVSIAFALSDALGRGFDRFSELIRAGGFDLLLLRPRSTALQLLGQEVMVRRLGRLVQGLVILGYAALAGTIDWTLGRGVLLVGTLACSVCVFLGTAVLQATSAFWTVDALEVWSAFTHGGLAMSQYPLAIYRGWFRALFTFIIPLGCVAYFPGVVILGRADPLGTPAVVGWLAPLAGPLFLAVCLQVWQIGVRHYRSTGS